MRLLIRFKVLLEPATVVPPKVVETLPSPPELPLLTEPQP